MISSPGDLNTASNMFDRLIERQVAFGLREGEPRAPWVLFDGSNGEG